MQKVNQPNFMIIGAMKAATTSLYTYLEQHPEIFMSSIKEPKFFNNLSKNLHENFEGKGLNKIKTFNQYYNLFDNVKNESAIGEASPSYLFDKKCPDLIFKHLPKTKIIIVLRQPVDRAYSHYLHAIRNGKEKELNFETALKEHQLPKKHFYKEKSCYANQLDRYYKLFPSENIKVFLFDDIIKNPMNVLSEVFAFLHVDTNFKPKITSENKSGIPKGLFGWILMKARYFNLVPDIRFRKIVPRYILYLLNKLVYKKPPKLNVKLRNKLTHKYFIEDIKKLEEIISKDLGFWII